MLFFIKIKLSSRLCLTHKRVTQKYINSTLIKKKKLRSDRIGIGDTHNFLDRIGSEKMVSLHPGPSLADAGPGARYGVGPPSVRLQWRYGGGGFDSVRRGARCDRTSCTAQRTALIASLLYIRYINTTE